MSPLAVVGWILTVTADLRLSQRKTLADLVEAAVRVGRSTLSAIGRGLRGTAAKHAIKRVWRFCDNDAVHPTDAMAGVLRRLLRKRKRCCWWPSTGRTCGGSTPSWPGRC